MKYSIDDKKASLATLLENCAIEDNRESITTCLESINELEKSEKIPWNQRSCDRWVFEGVKNTRFFHMTAFQRQEMNTIHMVQDPEGMDIKYQHGIEDVFIDYFTQHFATVTPSDVHAVAYSRTSCVNFDLFSNLNAAYTEDEVVVVVKEMSLDKASSPDGVNVDFYHKNENIVGKDVVSGVLDVLNNGASVDEINYTNIVLVPKKEACSTKDFRHINLCNVRII